ncbi:RrF2 family transcriptional regulator [Zongyangia hominis]|uniref:Rrf2 family transcriptional regulator n=1 Tax=Zongyangia hominis TaxID=2763677 RepID=A0A926EAB5_9FIRM|nr:Rrf2 family transcriptional regulator [Zongyangia hominis]MBC8569320.1 Rrf2 family transcriptional regulator [Zongyangia hominis]
MNSDFNIAVHALVYLSHKGCTLSSEALAENICTNPARVRKVLAKLSRAGLVATKEGGRGGCAIAREAGKITLRQVSEAVEACFVSTSWKSGDPHMECLVASGMARLMDGIYAQLDSQCKQHLETMTIRDLEEQIFRTKQPTHREQTAMKAAERTI